MTLKLGVQHLGLEIYKVYINDDLGLALQGYLKGKLAANHQINKIYVFEKIRPHGVVCPGPGAIYMYILLILRPDIR